MTEPDVVETNSDHEGLPTPAYEHECEKEECDHKHYGSNDDERLEGIYCGDHRSFGKGGVFEKKNELVRRSDVVQVIKNVFVREPDRSFLTNEEHELLSELRENFKTVV